MPQRISLRLFIDSDVMFTTTRSCRLLSCPTYAYQTEFERACGSYLVGGDGADHASRLLGWQAFDFAVFGKQLDDVVHDFAAFINVCVFSTAKQYSYLNFVVVLKKANRLLDFEPNIVLAGFGAHANFLKPSLMRLVLGLAFFLVVVEFAKIHDSADRRLRVTGNLNQIQPGFLGFVLRFLSWNDA